jgi:hypothetical protein
MTRIGLTAAVVAALGIMTPVLAVNPASGEVAALRKQVEALRAQEKANLTAIRIQFETIIKRDKVSEEILAKERHALAAQESELLKAAVSEADKQAIRARFEELRKVLHAEYKIDAAQIKELHAMEHALKERVQLVYRNAIHHIEAEIKAIEHAGKGAKKK